MNSSHEPALFDLRSSATALPGEPVPFTSGSPLSGSMAGDWADLLAPEAGRIHRIGDELQRRIDAGEHILPPPGRILRAFTQPAEQVKVLIIGQDPYPTPGHAVGLSFSVDPAVRPLPRSLVNIYKELQADLGIEPALHGDLSAWTTQGVLLLNRALSVTAGQANSHRKLGWEPVTELAVRALAARRRPDGSPAPLVAILWGRQAQSLAPLLGELPRIESAHPSPLSASRGFFGSRPFSRANELLVQQGATPVDWRLPGVR
ncbi:uracil-DNA glycosylase [Arthrobacter gandavensis]|uniref:uracil-DNA glycosylase n=1 Tax=Arthrobacter gandavensis TaxID=169960 RepID=UPI001890A309|nr:uracil-DNA glycosylase [Arthrobacter gandavensis]